MAKSTRLLTGRGSTPRGFESRPFRQTQAVSGLSAEWGERLSGLEDGWRTNAKWWPAWGWPSTTIALQKTNGNWLAPEVIRQLQREEAVDALVADIQGTIDKLEESETLGLTPDK